MTTRTVLPLFMLTVLACSMPLRGQQAVVVDLASQTASKPTPEERSFRRKIQPLLAKYCLRCHNAEEMQSGIRVDHLTGSMENNRLFLWKGMHDQIDDQAMPPEDELQPTSRERLLFTAWIRDAMNAARARDTARNGTIRRLTVSQYRNTLRQLLGLEEVLTDVLPPDSVSRDGFANNEQTLLLSPLLVESYFSIAERALDLTIVDPNSRPSIQNFRMDLGEGINPKPYPNKLILGANSLLLDNDDFQVTQLKAEKPFDHDPFMMQTQFRFIEGYQGNDTVRGWREFDSIYHAVFACMRGNPGYPKGLPYQPVPEGLLLRPAIPSAEEFQVESTYGPKANFKVSLRELPEHGEFRIRVQAARYEDGLLLERNTPPATAAQDGTLTLKDFADSPRQVVTIPAVGVYQLDIVFKAADKPAMLKIQLGNRHFSGQLHASGKKDTLQHTAFLMARLPAGKQNIQVIYPHLANLQEIRFTKVAQESELGQRFHRFENRTPWLGVYLGLRRDCGTTMTPVGSPQVVRGKDLQQYIFAGAINNHPSPDVEKGNVNYLAGVRDMGVRSEYTDGRDMPRLLIRSVEFEGPFYESWPPRSHRRIFIDSENKDDPQLYAREIIQSFASRAFRRPASEEEVESLVTVFRESFQYSGNFQESIKDALLVVLTSPQFLFLIENSATPDPEPLEAYELASKLSYFLWDEAPDARLLDLASRDQIHDSLDDEIGRMIRDSRFEQFSSEFVSQWLTLQNLDVVEIDRSRFPQLTRDTRLHLRQEPVRFVEYLIRNDLPLTNLVQSDFILANEVVAGYYGLADRTETGLTFGPLQHNDSQLGGLLTQAAILAGLSNGRESNPVKRGAWLARKIIAEPPDDPPPNVPELEEDTAHLSLRERLEAHRNQPGCAKCHSGIDPWGLPFEAFDAGGRFKTSPPIDGHSTLPDGSEVEDLNALKDYLANDRIDRVAYSFLKHLASYAVGRDLSYNELVMLEEQSRELGKNGYRVQQMLRFIITSDLFLKK